MQQIQNPDTLCQPNKQHLETKQILNTKNKACPCLSQTKFHNQIYTAACTWFTKIIYAVSIMWNKEQLLLHLNFTLQWRHGDVMASKNHRQLCFFFLLNSLFRLTIKYTALHYWPFVRGIHWCPVDSIWRGFPLPRASNAISASMWWHHHVHFNLVHVTVENLLPWKSIETSLAVKWKLIPIGTNNI